MTEKAMTALPPGSTIGILGGGQLGRMLAMAAARLGLKRTSLVSTMRRLGIVRPKPNAGANRDLRAR